MIMYDTLEGDYKQLPFSKKIMLNINLSKFIDNNRTNVLLIPNKEIYSNEKYYDEKEIHLRKPIYKTYNDFWLFTNYNHKNKTIDKINLNQLNNENYIIVILDTENHKQFQKFLEGDVEPELSYLEKTFSDVYKRNNMKEGIKNTISMHWFVSHSKLLPDIIKEYIILDKLPMKIYDPPKPKTPIKSKTPIKKPPPHITSVQRRTPRNPPVIIDLISDS